MQGYDILLIEDGKITELWVEQDMLALLQQIGMAPGPGQPPPTAPAAGAPTN
jgi:hypothetical protein